jgi:integrase
MGKAIIPHLELTEITDSNDIAARKVSVLGDEYYVRSKLIPDEGKRRDGKPLWAKHQFNLFPIILHSNGEPWAEANVYLINRLEHAVNPVISTYLSVANDLDAYSRFLGENEINWLHFPLQKIFRPTYRFNAHLKYSISSGDIAISTAKRRIVTVIGFYRWLEREEVFIPENPPWRESERYVKFTDRNGISISKKVVTTDVQIKLNNQHDPFDGTINDGGKLRPLTKTEQEWLIEALVELGNTEMSLIHVFSLITCARIQTTLTMRVRHALLKFDEEKNNEVLLPAGPGTGIDTKNGKKIVLHIPVWFYRMLNTYAISERAKLRRTRAAGGDFEDQYLFLSQRGLPFYQAHDDERLFIRDKEIHHRKVGQGVRQFISEKIIPLIRNNNNAPEFSYRFHDLRATSGMNFTDRQLQLVSQGTATLQQAREFVRVRMGHESSATTERYLSYRSNLKIALAVSEEHESHLQKLSSGLIN